ncbi:M48 family metallopeptidase [Paenibacillus sp. YYML68]|uniref:tetratricopeptide repeat protein n=1 Tax=Paenibacillus sp. YYML68 TaxID=2909250 RepID=UPI00249204ED|nr:hypothetical protein [Paenibacillus sp. YYML68]
MFKHLFASMNAMLDEVQSEYPSSTGGRRKQLKHKLEELKSMSDFCIEEWLQFEEKLAQTLKETGIGALGEGNATDPLDPEFAARRSDAFIRGQGYYKLHMFHEALAEFTELLSKQPEFTLARIYMAMSYFHLGRTADSYSHFHFLYQLTENVQLKAISLNAMGCIQIQHNNMERAGELFELAYRTDPTSIEPLIAMGLCTEKQGGLQFSFSGTRKSGVVKG